MGLPHLRPVEESAAGLLPLWLCGLGPTRLHGSCFGGDLAWLWHPAPCPSPGVRLGSWDCLTGSGWLPSSRTMSPDYCPQTPLVQGIWDWPLGSGVITPWSCG